MSLNDYGTYKLDAPTEGQQGQPFGKRITVSLVPNADVADADTRFKNALAMGQLLQLKPDRDNPNRNSWVPIGETRVTRLGSFSALAEPASDGNGYKVVLPAGPVPKQAGTYVYSIGIHWVHNYQGKTDSRSIAASNGYSLIETIRSDLITVT